MKTTVMTLAALFLAATMFAGDEKACDHSKAADAKATAEHSCNMAKEGKAVELTGKLLCRHCNLHETDKCEKVFMAEGETKYIAICKSSKGDLEALSEEGTATVKVKGKIVKCQEDGKEELMIEEIAKV